MMHCHKFRPLFSLCFEGEASYVDQAALSKHLGECSRCREAFDEFSTAAQWVKSLPRIEPSPGFEDRVLARVRASGHEPARSRPISVLTEPAWWQTLIPRLAWAGAFAAVGVVATLWALRSATVGADQTRVQSASAQEARTLKELIPDLPAEVVESLDGESYVLDRMTIRQTPADREIQVVAPVDQETGRQVFVTF
jgi:anti-sigma factor RsiW